RRFHPTGITKLYREFLIYKNFLSIEMPLLICEGKTDIIYIKCALNKLAPIYNEFVKINDKGINYKIKFLNFSNNLRDVFAISKGTSGLKHLMEIYENNIGRFKEVVKKHPVIIILDNDDGAKEIKKKLSIKKGDSIKPYYHFLENLYVLITPKGKDMAIEDLFDSHTLSKKLGGKIFNRMNNIDTENEYGKFVFAEKVIKENQNDINFDGFKDIFDGLKLIVEDYQK
ncbi:MAG: ribonuclease H, partial [Candidatus Marinimicrobia bacterium]|nr:ribonuclease H [Candidatus Neomarinimicrobiota bacterium]